jgi:hypothetical protein
MFTRHDEDARRLEPRSGWKRFALRFVLGAWVVICVLICIRAALWPARHTVYPAFSDAGRCWLRGGDNYDLHFYGLDIDQYRYAPLVTVGFVPFGLLPDAVGGVLWRLLNMAAFFGGVVVYGRMVWPGSDRISVGGAAAIGALMAPLSLQSLNNGQANPLVIGLLLLAVAAALHGRWNWAAFALAAPIALKLYPVAIALLLLLAYPRQLGWRLAAILLVGTLLPFATHHPDHVARQYDQWFTRLMEDDRAGRAFADSYRDGALLLRLVGLPLSAVGYRLLQFVAAAPIALIVLHIRRRRGPTSDLLHVMVSLGCCWMVLFGPATENCTYILLAPIFALSVWEGFTEPRSLWTRLLLAVIVGMFVAGALITALPDGRNWAYPLNPLAALLLLVERLANLGSTAGRMPAASPWYWPEASRA